MPNKTIYVSDGDLEIIEQAAAKYGGNLSSTIVKILKESLEGEARREDTADGGFQEIIVEVGQNGCYLKQRFTGRVIAKWNTGGASEKHVFQQLRLYQTAKGNLALYSRAKTNWESYDWNDCKAWKNYKKGEGKDEGVWKLRVYNSLDEFKELIPKDILPIIEKKLQGVFIEDLDI